MTTSKPGGAVNPDGSVDVLRLGVTRYAIHDLYHRARRAGWSPLILTVATAWLGLNLLFAFLFSLQSGSVDGARPGSFVDVFFFSVQTFSTIGYGSLSPGTHYAELLVTIEALVSLLFTAVTTGLVFAKFSTPVARVVFARNPLITTFDGRRVFMLRLGNERMSQVLEASASVTFVRNDTTSDGHTLRRFEDLILWRSRSPLLDLGWTLFHEIDEGSPLFGMGPDELARARGMFVVVVSGVDDTLGTGVHARRAYDHTDVRFEARYASIFRRTQPGDPMLMDYDRLHDLEPPPSRGETSKGPSDPPVG